MKYLIPGTILFQSAICYMDKDAMEFTKFLLIDLPIVIIKKVIQ